MSGMNSLKQVSFILSALAVLGYTTASAQTVSYSDDVHPILSKRCYKCHGGKRHKGKFSMNTREDVLQGGELGPALVLGDSENSLMIELLTSSDKKERMPPKGDRLSPEQVDILRAWIDAGLPWDATVAQSDAWKVPLAPRAVDLPRGEGVHGSRNPIDRIVNAYFGADEVDAPALVDDYRYIRRVYLDVVGLLPSPETVRTFVNDRKGRKRDSLVDALLADRRSYAEHWMTFWNDALRNDFQGTGYIDGGRKQITGWLYRALYENKPYNQFATELIAPRRDSVGFVGGIKWRGAQSANQRVPLQAARSVSEVFLGVNLKCASCHDSFVNEWTLADAYGLATAFSEAPLELVRCDVPMGDLAEAKFLWPELGGISADAPVEHRREQVAALVTSPENGRFARMIVNRVWAALMGRGLIEPLGAMDAEPWNADLLDWLAWTFAENDYDLQALIRLIVTSNTYQLESDVSEPAADAYAFRGPIPRRLSAEQFYDAMSCVTGVWQGDAKFSPRPDANSASTATVRAWRVPADPLMQALGRPNREQVVLARDRAYTRLQALVLTNGEVLAQFASRGAAKLLEGGPIETGDLFLRALGRPATAAESAAIERFGDGLTRPEDAEDLLWILFMHPEFQMVL